MAGEAVSVGESEFKNEFCWSITFAVAPFDLVIYIFYYTINYTKIICAKIMLRQKMRKKERGL